MVGIRRAEEVLYCKLCKTAVNPPLRKLTFCECGKSGIDATEQYIRVIGNYGDAVVYGSKGDYYAAHEKGVLRYD